MAELIRGTTAGPAVPTVLTSRAKSVWVFKAALRQLLFNGLPILAVLAVWELIAATGMIHAALFPSLQQIFSTMVSLTQQGILLQDVLGSLSRLLVSVIIGIALGTSIGLFMGTSRLVERALSPLLSFGLAVPGIALIPLAILWFGLTEKTIIAILALEVTLVVMLNTWGAVKTVEQRFINAARTMGADGLQLFLRVLLPGSLPGLITGYRLGFSRAWRILVAGEMLAGVANGLGYRIYEARQLLASDIVYAGIIVIGVFGLILERVFLRSLEAMTVERWGLVRSLE